MGTGYTRNDASNNIADGNVINASDLDGEFDAVQSAFNGSSGHSHDGTTGEGPLIATAGLADDAVTTAKITDANVTTAKIADANITVAKMAANSINSDQYVDGSIDRAHLAADIVDGTKIADDSINSEHYVDGSIDTAHIADAQVTLAKIANQGANSVLVRDANSSGVVSAKAVGDTQLLIGDGTGFTAAALSGDVTMTNAGAVTIAAGAVENSMLADDAVGADELAANAVVTASIVDANVTTAKIADANVTTAKILDANVTTAKIAGDAITGAKIADDAIDSEHYTDGSIDTAHIAADAVTNAKIADDSIDSEHYVDGSIDTAHIAADAITGAKIADDAINSEHYTDGSIDTAHIADSQITLAKMAANSVDSNQYVDGSIDTAHIANDAVTSDKIDTNIQIAGTLGVTGETTLTTHLNLGDSDKIKLGAGGDLEIYHDGSNSYIDDTGTGDLILRASDDLRLQKYTGEDMITCNVDNGVDIFHNNVNKLQTTSDGISVSGNVSASSGGFMGSSSSDKIVVGANDIDFFINGNNEFRFESDGDFHADADVIAFSTTVSDERLKTDIEKIENATDKVNQLNGYTFTYKADGKQSAGVIAQEVEKVLPSAVNEKVLPLKTDDGVAYKTVQYDQIIGLLIESIKELKQEINELKGV